MLLTGKLDEPLFGRAVFILVKRVSPKCIELSVIVVNACEFQLVETEGDSFASALSPIALLVPELAESASRR